MEHEDVKLERLRALMNEQVPVGQAVPAAAHAERLRLALRELLSMFDQERERNGGAMGAALLDVVERYAPAAIQYASDARRLSVSASRLPGGALIMDLRFQIGGAP